MPNRPARSGVSDLFLLRPRLLRTTTEAARAATKTIPIVMTGVGNPVGSGFVKSISQPGGNITGLSNDSIEVSSKYLEYLRDAVPNLMCVGVLIDPKHPNHPTVLKQVQVGVQAIGASVSSIEMRSVSEIDAALRLIQQDRLDALIVPPDPTFSHHLSSDYRVRDQQSAAHYVWAKARS